MQDGDEGLLDQKRMALEFSSFSDGKEAVTKAANLLFAKYLKLANLVGDHEEKIFTEPNMDEALKAIGMFYCQFRQQSKSGLLKNLI